MIYESPAMPCLYNSRPEGTAWYHLHHSIQDPQHHQLLLHQWDFHGSASADWHDCKYSQCCAKKCVGSMPSNTVPWACKPPLKYARSLTTARLWWQSDGVLLHGAEPATAGNAQLRAQWSRPLAFWIFLGLKMAAAWCQSATVWGVSESWRISEK